MSSATTVGAATLLVALVVLAEARRGRRLSTLGSLLGLPRSRHFWPGRALFPAAVAAVALAAVSAPRPTPPEIESVPGSVVLVLDVSASMGVEDGTPDRMAAARLVAARVTGALEGVRIGVVAFAGRAYLLVPPTTDHRLVLSYVELVDPTLMTAQGSTLAAAIEEGLRAAARSDSLYGAEPRGIVVISDGEGFDDLADLERAVEGARTLGVPVHTVAVGTRGGGAVPGAPPGSWSRADPERLTALASSTGGVAVLSPGRGVERVEAALARTAVAVPDPVVVPRAPIVPTRILVLVACALALLTLEWGLTSAARRPT